ncbi:hypothetical protein ACJ41O_000938 [Fusarium nematophilum]
MATIVLRREKIPDSPEDTLESIAKVILIIIALILAFIATVGIVCGSVVAFRALAHRLGWSWAGFKRCFRRGRSAREDAEFQLEDIELQSGIARPAGVAVRGKRVPERVRVGRVMTPESSDDETLMWKQQKPRSIV